MQAAKHEQYEYYIYINYFLKACICLITRAVWSGKGSGLWEGHWLQHLREDAEFLIP